MFSHVMIGANDVDALVAFYDVVLKELGISRDLRQGSNPAGFVWQRPGHRWPQFAVRRPFNGRPATVGNGVQVSFSAISRHHVVAAWECALDNGGSDEGRPDSAHNTTKTFSQRIAGIQRETSCVSCTPG